MVYWLVIGVGINFIGLSLEILGVYKLANGIFISDDRIKKLSDFPVYETTTGFSIKGGGHMNAAAISKKDLEEFKNNLISEAISERDAGRIGFRLLITGLILQVFGVVILAIPQVLRYT